MSYSQYFLHNLMDMGSSLRTILGTILKYKRTPMSGPLIRQILTGAHMSSKGGGGLGFAKSSHKPSRKH